MNLNVHLQLRDHDGTPFLGKGPIRLLKEIDCCGSINQAAKKISMSYSKAHGMIKRLEAKIDSPLLKKKTGGSKGGGTILTAKGHCLVDEYQRIEEALKHTAMKAVQHSVVLKNLT